MSLDVKNLTTGYGPITILRDVSINMEDNSILGVLGRNGMGKTTFIQCLAGMLPVNSGQIALGGQDITGFKSYERAIAGISTVPQDGGVFPNLTVMENLKLGKMASTQPIDRLDEVFTYFPRLKERVHQAAGTLSGGEQRMLSIGRALMANAKVMLLDEPSDGVMPILVKQIANNLAEINRKENITMIIVEQNVSMVLAMTNNCAIMEKGQIVLKGTKESPLSKEEIESHLTV